MQWVAETGWLYTNVGGFFIGRLLWSQKHFLKQNAFTLCTTILIIQAICKQAFKKFKDCYLLRGLDFIIFQRIS